MSFRYKRQNVMKDTPGPNQFRPNPDACYKKAPAFTMRMRTS